jgi:hypothetical protein
MNTESGFLPLRTENTKGNYKFCNRDDRELERGDILLTANTCFEVVELRVAHRYAVLNLLPTINGAQIFKYCLSKVNKKCSFIKTKINLIK